MFFAEGNAENGSTGIRTDARERHDIFFAPRKFRSMQRDDLLRRLLQISRAAVIPEAGPQSQYFFLGCLGERRDIREAREEPLVIWNHGRDARLLQHDL